MRLQKYINENLKADEIESIKKFVKKNCQYHINLVKKNKVQDPFFYRGMNKSKKVILGNTRKDRKPKDTNPVIHNLTDKIFKKLFGWKARSQGLFVYPISEPAEFYANVYMILPIGKYDYLWAPEVHDLYKDLYQIDSFFNIFSYPDEGERAETFEELFKFATKTWKRMPDNLNTLKKFIYVTEKKLETILDRYYTNKDFKNMMNSKSEIMINCDKYLALKNVYTKKTKNYIIKELLN